MTTKASYDLIVLGDELAGLVAATLCARRGMRVLLGQLAPRPTSYTLGGIKLPVEPLLLPGLGGPAIRRVFDELHFQHMVKRRLRIASPAFQLVTPDARIDVEADDAALARALGRELGDDHPAGRQLERATLLAAALDRVFDGGARLPPDGFFERRELTRLAGGLVADAAGWAEGHGDPLGGALAALPAALTGGAAGPLSPLAVARALDQLRQGAPRLAGDHEALREVFLDKFASHSGEVRTLEPTALVTSWSKVTGLHLASGEELGAGHVIAAMPIAGLGPLLDGKPARRIAELAEAATLVGHRYTLNLVLDAIGVPEGMGPLVLAVADPGAPLVAGNALAIHVAPPDDRARVVVTVQAIAPLPAAGEALGEILVQVRRALREHLAQVMPFYEDHVRFAHSPNQDAPAEGLDAELAEVAPPRPLWRPTAAGALGLSALEHATGVKHLTLASSQVLPGLGLEGEILSGWSAARLACEAAGKKRDYLQGEVIEPG